MQRPGGRRAEPRGPAGDQRACSVDSIGAAAYPSARLRATRCASGAVPPSAARDRTVGRVGGAEIDVEGGSVAEGTLTVHDCPCQGRVRLES